MTEKCLTQSEAHKIESRLDEILSEIKKIHGGFPRNDMGETDFSGHREAHEEMIKAARAQAEFWNELKLDVAKKGIWGILIVVVGLIVAGLAAKLGIAEFHALR